MDRMKNLYRVLGITNTATEEEIKKAYRTLSKKHHPDANPGDGGREERFKEISEAYAILQNPQKRQEYDQMLKAEEKNTVKKEKKVKKMTDDPSAESSMNFNFSRMDEQFAQFFGFQPKNGNVDEEAFNKSGKTKTNPIDMTEMFERYMGIKK
ncbi:J domain-containing protein [Lacrimispora sp.]|uniref:J domain-containing protein n=1 Tax=Lacrimispora sp. TaxID=2719234 RepID=UPI0028ADE662|nr:DnaJ domain-containing protein [Lacrimispora sp.]